MKFVRKGARRFEKKVEKLKESRNRNKERKRCWDNGKEWESNRNHKNNKSLRILQCSSFENNIYEKYLLMIN